MHRCTVSCFNHTHNQGKGCLCDTNASRAAIGLAPLHTKEGGHVYRDGLSFPMQPGEGMEQDEPLYSCDSVMELLPSWVAWLFVVAAAVCMAIACGLLDPLFPR